MKVRLYYLETYNFDIINCTLSEFKLINEADEKIRKEKAEIEEERKEREKLEYEKLNKQYNKAGK